MMIGKSRSLLRRDLTKQKGSRADVDAGDSLPDELQLVTQGIMEEIPPAIDDAGGNSEQENEPVILPPVVSERRKGANGSKPKSARNGVHSMPNGKTTRARCKNRLEMRKDGLGFPQTFGDVITAEGKVSTEESEWVCDAMTCCDILFVPLSVWCSSVNGTQA